MSNRRLATVFVGKSKEHCTSKMHTTHIMVITHFNFISDEKQNSGLREFHMYSLKKQILYQLVLTECIQYVLPAFSILSITSWSW